MLLTYRISRGILPRDSHSFQRDKLRREREKEYQEFAQKRWGPRSVPHEDSIAGIRQKMQREREEELAQHRTMRADPTLETRGPDQLNSRSRTNSNSPPNRDTPYLESLRSAKDHRVLFSFPEDPRPPQDRFSSMREQRMAEERRYRNNMHREVGRYNSDVVRRRRWDEDLPRVRFEEDYPPTKRETNTQKWDDEERDLMQWARERRRHRVPTPPIYESPRKHEKDTDRSSLRSISAPVVAEGIAGLGAREDPATRRNRQREYAEELRAQIREREEARQRERLEQQGAATRNSSSRLLTISPEPVLKPHPLREREEPYAPPQDFRVRDRPSDFRERRPPKSPHYERYSPYPPPHHHPSYHDYSPPPDQPPRWIPPYHYPGYPAYPYHYPPPHPAYMRDPYLSCRRPDPWEFEFKGRPRPARDEPDHVEFTGRLSRKTVDDEDEFGSPFTRASSDKSPKLDKASYRAELERQMREKKEKEAKERIEKGYYDLKKEAEVYDPWGKGGGGAPIRDRHGRLVTDLKKMRQMNNEKLLKGNVNSSPSPPPPQEDSHRPNTENDPQRVNYSCNTPQDVEDQKRSAQEEYREFLRRQVEEKEAVKRKEKELKRIEEQKELERLERDRKKLQEDFKREQEKQRRKEEEVRAKNEAIKHEVEERRRADARKREEEEQQDAKQPPFGPLSPQQLRSPPVPRHRRLEVDRPHFASPPHLQPTQTDADRTYQSSSPPVPALQHKLQQIHPEYSPRHLQVELQPSLARNSSPPVPALQHKLQQESYRQQDTRPEPPPPRTNSPPVPALRAGSKPTAPHLPGGINAASQMQPRTGEEHKAEEKRRNESLDILQQLSVMKEHLQSELSKPSLPLRKQVEDSSVDDISARPLLRPKMVAPRVRKPQKTEGDNGTLSQILGEFNALKYQPSRQKFAERFPGPVQSESALEVQQEALLRHQAAQLVRMRASSHRAGKETATTTAGGGGGGDLLVSDSTKLPVSDEHPFLSREPSRVFAQGTSGKSTQAPRHRRRQWQADLPSSGSRLPSPGTQSQFSISTFDVDNMAQRNEERKRRLDAILHASDRTRRPQSILQDFLQRTSHAPSHHPTQTSISRESEKSLECETGFHPLTSAHT